MDKEYVINSVRSFADKVREKMDVRQIILFGSYATGTAGEWSDIDVAVVTNGPVADWLESSAELFKISGNIDHSIEPHLLDHENDRSGFLEEIRRTGEMIYDREQQ
ncbi:MAG: nucleotidyltransferase domain-containing protein [Armatimonadota bacterium]|nr:nucleotidyltransferase domain-containing protein [Armatimonadota bacterium]